MRPKPTPPPTPNLTICCATSRWRGTPCACAAPARSCCSATARAGWSQRREWPAGSCRRCRRGTGRSIRWCCRCRRAMRACAVRRRRCLPCSARWHRTSRSASASNRSGSRATRLSSRLTSTTLGCTAASRRGWCGPSSMAASSCAHRLRAGACRRCGFTPAASAAPPGVVTARVFAPRFHEIFNEPEQAEVFAVLAAWLSPPSMTRR